MTMALVKKVEDALPAHPLARIEDLRSSWAALAPVANIVTPVASIDNIIPFHRVSLRAVVIDTTVDPQWGNGPECYKGSFCAANERALGKVALEKIAAAAGVQTVYTIRRDDRSSPYYCEFEVQLGMRDFDGMLRVATKSRAVDLRDGSPDAVKLKSSKKGQAAVDQARSAIAQNAESKAWLRALRTLLTLKQKYTTDELAKPFVIPKLVPFLDPSDPDQKAALLQMATQGERALFGALPPAAGDVRQLKDATPPPPQTSAPPPPAAAAPPPPVGAVSEDLEDAEDADDAGAQLDLLEVQDPAPAAEAELLVCGCPCDCQAEVAPAVAKATEEAFGSIRCSPCAPGKSFDYGRHKDLGTLGLKRYPKLTPDEVKRQLDAKAAKAAPAGGRR